MNLEEKAQKTVLKLLQMTLKGDIEWNRITDTRPLVYGTDDVVPMAYTTSLAGNIFALYEERFRTMDADENIYWSNRVVLKLIDADGRPVWEFPPTPQLSVLLRKVQPKAAGVEASLDKVLNW